MKESKKYGYIRVSTREQNEDRQRIALREAGIQEENIFMDKQSMNKPRESNYDLLRIVSAIAVITIHVSSSYTNAVTSSEIFGDYYLEHILTTCTYNVLSRFAVPCFIMLSGAFILADERNADFRFFYQKTFRNVGIPALLFSFLYFIYFTLIKIMKIIIKGSYTSEVLLPLKNWIKGNPCYHMWYLYMMIGVYLLVPVILALKKQIGEQRFEKTAWVFLSLASICYWTSSHLLKWDIGFSFYFCGYFMIGYVLRKKAASKKNNFRAVSLIAAGFLTETVIVYPRCLQALNRVPDDELKYSLIGPLAPQIVLASVFLFAGFSRLSIRKDLGRLSSYTFLIYLLHAGIWDVIQKVIMKQTALSLDNRIIIPAFIIIVFFLSLLASMVYQAVWNWIERKWSVSDKLCLCWKALWSRFGF